MKTFKPMLAPNQSIDIKTLTYPLMASYKLDGIRCIFKNGQMFSRVLKQFPNVQLRKRWLLKNKDKLRKYRRKYWLKTRTKGLAQQRIWKKKHKKEIKMYTKTHKLQAHIYYLKNKETKQRQAKEYYDKNRIKILKQQKEHNKIRKNEINEYHRNRFKTNINFKITHYLRTRICKVLKGSTKAECTLKLVSCSIEFLKRHLSSKFVKGMSFSNYGKWHIDHIKPCASFDLSKVSEQRKCFNWKNLQPLWAKDNLRKGAK